MITDRDTNLHLGAAYLKRLLVDFDGSLAMAAAAYNAGPGRPRRWREGALMEPAAWAEIHPLYRNTRLREEGAVQFGLLRGHAGPGPAHPEVSPGRPVGPRDPAAAPDRDLP
jgi:soluble lytic murein transglycosylase